MTRHFKYSKGLHVLTLFCFLLPFFNTSCDGKSKEEKEKEEMEMAAKADTVIVTEDTGYVVEENISIPVTDSVNTTTNPKKKDELPSITLSEKVPFLKPILNPSENVYSGLGTIIDSLQWLPFFITPVAFLLLLISLTAKFIDKNTMRTIILLDLLSFIFLLIAKSLSWDCERLWGLWVTITSIGVLTIYDIFINRQFGRQEQKGSS
jgi:hypothetical protein